MVKGEEEDESSEEDDEGRSREATKRKDWIVGSSTYNQFEPHVSVSQQMVQQFHQTYGIGKPRTNAMPYPSV